MLLSVQSTSWTLGFGVLCCLQVMKVLGAGSDARLAVTRNLRVMSPQDREWLLSITYPHLQVCTYLGHTAAVML